MAILITGGAGFIGSHTCEKLLKEGEEIICLDNFNDYYDSSIKEENIKAMLNNKGFFLERCDITHKNEK